MSRWCNPVVRVAGLGLMAFAFSGCVGSRDPMAPADTRNAISGRAVGMGAADPSSAGLFYPLDIGNHWSFARTITTQTIPNEGQPGDPYVGESTMDVDLVGTAERFGREYVVQREDLSRSLTRLLDRFSLSPGSRRTLQRRSRAWGYGIRARCRVERVVERLTPSTSRMAERLAYQQALRRVWEMRERIEHVALVGRMPVGSAVEDRPGPLTGEIALLRYPLHPGSTWNVREDPLVVYLVEANERVALPAGDFSAYRIRIDWPDVFGPNDRALVWYGRDGLLKLQVHVEGQAVDADGNDVRQGGVGRAPGADRAVAGGACRTLDRRAPEPARRPGGAWTDDASGCGIASSALVSRAGQCFVGGTERALGFVMTWDAAATRNHRPRYRARDSCSRRRCQLLLLGGFHGGRGHGLASGAPGAGRLPRRAPRHSGPLTPFPAARTGGPNTTSRPSGSCRHDAIAARSLSKRARPESSGRDGHAGADPMLLRSRRAGAGIDGDRRSRPESMRGARAPPERPADDNLLVRRRDLP